MHDGVRRRSARRATGAARRPEVATAARGDPYKITPSGGADSDAAWPASIGPNEVGAKAPKQPRMIQTLWQAKYTLQSQLPGLGAARGARV